MEQDIIRIPVNETLFTDKKQEEATEYLSNFFGNDYNCSFVIDSNDNVLCLQIKKN